MSVLRRLGRPNIVGLAAALAGGRIAPPFRRSQLLGHVPDHLLDGVLDELQDLSARGMTPPHLARMLHLLAEERADAQAVADRVELVWSGTEVLTATSRDTAVVVQELFREARESVLIASYALDTGSKAKELFGPLAGRMDAEPGLRVRLFVNIHRKQRDDTADAVLLREFADTFQHDLWPGKRLPETFYDPPQRDLARRRARATRLPVGVAFPARAAQLGAVLLHHRGQDLLARSDAQIEIRAFNARERAQHRQGNLDGRGRRPLHGLETGDFLACFVMAVTPSWLGTPSVSHEG